MSSAEPRSNVGVVGAGTMAPGIAASFATAGHPVLLWARAGERAESAARQAREMADFLVQSGLRSDLGVVTRVSDLESLETCGLVVEAIAEDLTAKQELFARLDDVCPPSALLATNTSGLRVREIGSLMRNRERLIAMHFWNPAHLMPLVEVAGEEASPEAIELGLSLSREIGKTPVLLRREVLGFLGVRMLQAVVREAIALLQADVASAEDIDAAVRASFGIRFPVLGPLETTDFSGLDVIASIHEYLLPDLDCSSEPQQALRSRVEEGAFGVKSGRGFYEWGGVGGRDADAVVRRRDEELARRLALLEKERLQGAR